MRSQSSKISTPWCARHRGVQIVCFATNHQFRHTVDVFTPKRISPDCPLKSNQRQTKISIWSPRCTVWLLGVLGMMHSAEIDSTEWCTQQIFTFRCDAHRRDWLDGVMHTAEIVSAEWCTPRSFLLRYCVFLTLKFLDLLTPRYDAHRKVWLSGVMHNAEIYNENNKN